MSHVFAAPSFPAAPLRSVAAAAAITALLCGATPASAARQPAKPAKGSSTAAATTATAATAAGPTVELAKEVTLAAGKSTLMRLPSPAARIAVGDAKVADVILLNPSEVYMLGKAPGSTNLIIWNRANQASVIDITVGLDTAGLRAQFSELFPNERDIRITVSGNSLILSGTVADAVRASQVVQVASAYLQRSARNSSSGNTGAAQDAASQAAQAIGGGAPSAASGAAAGAAWQQAMDPSAGQSSGNSAGRVVNMLSVAAPQQVMLEVKIAEVSKTLVDQLGAAVGLNGTRGSWTYTFLSSLLSGNGNKIDAFNNSSGKFVTLDAQKNDGLVKVLAEPTVMAISGQEASFLAGGKLFIPVAQSSGSGTSTVTLEEKEYGIAVRFTPTVLENGRINLKVSPEVSELNKDGVSVSASGSSTTQVLPAFTTRRASTTVQLYDGQSFAIGGLIKNNVTSSIKAFPGLGEIPILGALFRSSDFQNDRTELVFIVTPHLAQPLPVNHKLPTDDYVEPSRVDFFLKGKMEGKPPAPPDTAPAASPATPVTPATPAGDGL
ncbi:type II and III secretion system protein family protein [Duganella sp. FT80W]|uniref:Type II and III secretion system protein family protein n=1 Tax=Duganella guangzhouensis TaxID=2666084 RepID=A0A6I2L8H3_9BURK|nr:type II and III secretion system protein family protein [Duganella guangzhouensis]MRW92579.1 type II and III secretion system protein family protein [Duganella guangzhouensis]